MSKEHTEIRFNDQDVRLRNHHVTGSILPQRMAELGRTITVDGDTIVEGAIYAHKMEVRNGETIIKGAVFTQLELYVNSEAQGRVIFEKSVASASSVAGLSRTCELSFHSDINAKSVALYGAFVAGSIYADEITLEDCVVIGGVFATTRASIGSSIVGTFNAPGIELQGAVGLLLPSAFSIERIATIPGTRLYNLSLADLGSMYRGMPQAQDSGRIEMDLEADQIATSLRDEKVERHVRSWSVVGRVLAADLVEMDKFHNHFLLTAASLGTQLLTNYDLPGSTSNGQPAALSMDRLRQFFFALREDPLKVRELDGTFDLARFAKGQSIEVAGN